MDPYLPTRLIYTLCFLTRNEHVLMLRRRFPPNKDLWNGVGGRIEPGEDPRAACLREVWEETGYQLENVHFAGVLTWEGFEIPEGGLYIYTAPAPQGEPSICDEGTLCWQPRTWAFSAPEVVSNIHYFLPPVLSGALPQGYHFAYRGEEIVRREIRSLPPGIGNG
jgi:8-oxo-dGTP diphosphatase